MLALLAFMNVNIVFHVSLLKKSVHDPNHVIVEKFLLLNTRKLIPNKSLIELKHNCVIN
jgi:hypothetical protein